MNRRSFLVAAAASIFVPQFGRFYREGSGRIYQPKGLMRLSGAAFRRRRWTTDSVFTATGHQTYQFNNDTLMRVVAQIEAANAVPFCWPVHPRFL